MKCKHVTQGRKTMKVSKQIAFFMQAIPIPYHLRLPSSIDIMQNTQLFASLAFKSIQGQLEALKMPHVAPIHHIFLRILFLQIHFLFLIPSSGLKGMAGENILLLSIHYDFSSEQLQLQYKIWNVKH